MLRHFTGLRLRDFDIETMHAVVFNLERGDAGRLALTRFELEQKVAAVGLDVTKLVEFAIKAIGHNAAVTDVDGGFRANGACEHIAELGGDGRIGQSG